MFAFLDWKNTVAYCRTPSSNGINIRVARKPGETGIAPERVRGPAQAPHPRPRGPEAIRSPASASSPRSTGAKTSSPARRCTTRPTCCWCCATSASSRSRTSCRSSSRATEVAGTHHPDGVFLAYGPGISQGAKLAPAQDRRRRRDPALQPRPRGALRFRGPGAAGDVHRRAAWSASGGDRRGRPRARAADDDAAAMAPGREGADHGPAADAGLHGVAMPVAVVGGIRVNYLQLAPDAGAAEDLVMVHGLATNLAFWYAPYATELAKRYRVTLYDLRGHGRSETPPAGYRAADLARDLRGLLDHLDIRRAHVLAHSFGGVVALNLACADPRARRQPGACRHPHRGRARRRQDARLGRRRSHPEDPRRRRQHARCSRPVLRLPAPHRGGTAAATGRPGAEAAGGPAGAAARRPQQPHRDAMARADGPHVGRERS